MQTMPDAVFKSLADPTRRALFERLSRDGEQTVRMLTDTAGVSQPAVSKHLRVLSGLVWCGLGIGAGRRITEPSRGRWRPLVDWMSYYSRFWHDRFDRLEDLLKRMDQ